MQTRTPILVWAGLVLCMIGSAVIGIDMGFTVYAVLLKETFNFTQTQVELTASMGTVGAGLSFLETIITGRFGYGTTFIFCWILMPLGAGLISLAALYKEIFAGLPVFIYAGQLTMSISDSVAQMAFVRINIERFSSQHSGKIVGMSLAMCSFGKMMYAILVDFVFSRDLAGFFFAISVTFLVFFGVCFSVLYLEFRRPHKVGSSSVESKGTQLPKKNPFVTSSDDNGNQLKRQVSEENHQGLCHSLEEGTSSSAKTPLLSSEKGEAPSSLSIERSVPIGVMLKSSSFHLTFWPSVLFYAIGYTCMNNITSVSVSAGLDNLNTVYVFSLCLVATRILFGLVFDKCPVLLCCVALLSVSYVCFAAAMLLGMFVMNERTVYMVTVLSGIGMGPGMTIPIAMIMALFGKSHYGKVGVAFWGFLSLLQLLIQIFVGLTYDSQSNVQQVGHYICYGQKCFFWPFALMLLITIAVFISQWLNYALSREKEDAD